MSTRLPDGGVVLLDLQSELYFGLNEVGATVWDGIAAGEDLTQLIARVQAAFDVDDGQAEEDIGDLIDELLKRDLVSAVDED